MQRHEKSPDINHNLALDRVSDGQVGSSELTERDRSVHTAPVPISGEGEIVLEGVIERRAREAAADETDEQQAEVMYRSHRRALLRKRHGLLRDLGLVDHEEPPRRSA